MASSSECALPRVVITGVAGFIGSNLAAHLVERGRDVLGIDNLVCGYEENLTRARSAAATPSATGTFSFLRASCGDAEAAAALRAGDIVVHLGAISALASNQEAPGPAYANNVASTAGLLEACRLAGVAQVIFASTGALYENTPELPQSEAHVVAPNLIYSLGKKHCVTQMRGVFLASAARFKVLGVRGGLEILKTSMDKLDNLSWTAFGLLKDGCCISDDTLFL